MVMSTIKYINATELKQLMGNPNLHIYDIREQDEYNREHIDNAKNVPLSSFNEQSFSDLTNEAILVFHCQGGTRTKSCEPKLQALKFKNIMILKNGIQAWKQLGASTKKNSKAPLPIMRQVQITAGILVLLGIVLDLLISPYFKLLGTFIGAGLVIAGISGFCGMANLLMLLPYNKNRQHKKS